MTQTHFLIRQQNQTQTHYNQTTKPNQTIFPPPFFFSNYIDVLSTPTKKKHWRRRRPILSEYRSPTFLPLKLSVNLSISFLCNGETSGRKSHRPETKPVSKSIKAGSPVPTRRENHSSTSRCWKVKSLDSDLIFCLAKFTV